MYVQEGVGLSWCDGVIHITTGLLSPSEHKLYEKVMMNTNCFTVGTRFKHKYCPRTGQIPAPPSAEPAISCAHGCVVKYHLQQVQHANNHTAISKFAWVALQQKRSYTAHALAERQKDQIRQAQCQPAAQHMGMYIRSLNFTAVLYMTGS